MKNLVYLCTLKFRHFMIRLSIEGIVKNDKYTESAAIILRETDGDRKLPIVISMLEMQSIAMAFKGAVAPRPLTHDLFANYLRTTGVRVENIYIKKHIKGLFFADINFVNKSNHKKTLDSRTSDAIAMALRFNAPIFCSEAVIDEAGMSFYDDDFVISDDDRINNGTTKEDVNDISNIDDASSDTMSLSEIEQKMQEAINREDYGAASKYRDLRNKKLQS